jgi:hypothetical protein
MGFGLDTLRVIHQNPFALAMSTPAYGWCDEKLVICEGH